MVAISPNRRNWLKPLQVLLGSTSSRLTIPLSASTIPHVGLKATINIVYCKITCRRGRGCLVVGRSQIKANR